MENNNKNLNESGLSKIYQHIQNHDIAMITAFRYMNRNCSASNEDELDHVYTKQENYDRNKKLYAYLISKGHDVTKIDGSYVENFGEPEHKEVKENSYFVVNLKDDPNFIINIINIGKFFCQDSVLIKEKGSENAYLYGTNNSDSIGLDQKVEVGAFKGGTESQFMSQVNNRPFVFNEGKHHNNAARGLMSEISNRIEKNIKK